MYNFVWPAPFIVLHVVALSTASSISYGQIPVCKFAASPNPVALTGKTTFSCLCNPPANYTFIYQLLKDPTTGEDRWGVYTGSNSLVLSNIQQHLYGRYECWAKFQYPYSFPENSVIIQTVLKELSGPTKLTLMASPSVLKECERVTLVAQLDVTATVYTYTFKNIDTGVELTAASGKNSVTINSVDKKLHHGRWVATATGGFGQLQSNTVFVSISYNIHGFVVGCEKRRYVFNKCRKTHAEATSWCRAHGMKLAVPGDKVEMSRVCQAIRNFDPNIGSMHYWTGVSRDTSGSPWMDRICKTPALFPLKVDERYPGNCLSIYDDLPIPHDCNAKQPFVCVKAGCDVQATVHYGGDTYYAFKRQRTRYYAKISCQTLGMQLFSINTLPEMQGVCDKLLNLGLASTPYWSGPRYNRKQNSWLDTCGAPIPPPVMTILKEGEYADYQGNKCTVLKDDYYFARPCEECRGFICEKNPDDCPSP